MATDADHDEGDGLNPVWLANNYLRRRKYDECIAICTGLLEKNPYDQVRRSDETRGTVGRRPGCDPTPTPATALRGTDPTLPSSTSPLHSQAVWYLKCRALTLKNWIDDMEIEEEVRPPRLFFSNGQERIDVDSTPTVLPVPRDPRASPRFCWTKTPPRRCPAREPLSCVPTPPPARANPAPACVPSQLAGDPSPALPGRRREPGPAPSGPWRARSRAGDPERRVQSPPPEGSFGSARRL